MRPSGSVATSYKFFTCCSNARIFCFIQDILSIFTQAFCQYYFHCHSRTLHGWLELRTVEPSWRLLLGTCDVAPELDEKTHFVVSPSSHVPRSISYATAEGPDLTTRYHVKLTYWLVPKKVRNESVLSTLPKHVRTKIRKFPDSWKNKTKQNAALWRSDQQGKTLTSWSWGLGSFSRFVVYTERQILFIFSFFLWFCRCCFLFLFLTSVCLEGANNHGAINESARRCWGAGKIDEAHGTIRKCTPQFIQAFQYLFRDQMTR